MFGGEVEDEEAAARHAFEDGLLAELELGGEVLVEFFASLHGGFASIEISNIDVGEVVAAVEEGKVEGGLVAPESGAPDPWFPFCRGVGDDQDGFGLGF